MAPLFFKNRHDEKLIPTQFKIHNFSCSQNQNNTSFLLDSQRFQLSLKTKETTKEIVKKSSLTKYDIDRGLLFHNIKNNDAIVILRFANICGKVLMSFVDM